MSRAISQNRKSIKNTGERMVPAYHKNHLVYGEHLVRYDAVGDLVKGKTVLDIASGSGYGTQMISKTAKKVTGVDYNKEAIKYAKQNYKSKNINYLHGDAKAIPLEKDSVDVVVSFETLEHIDDYQKFLAEIKRVLKPDGLLVLSTPNDVEFPEGADFHYHEFNQAELKKLVNKYFKNIKPYYQATWIYNALIDKNQLSSEWAAPVNTLNAAPIKADRALFFFFLCSNRPIKEKVNPVGAISEHWSTRKMLEHNAFMDKYMREMKEHYEKILKHKDSEIEKLKNKRYRKIAANSRRAAAMMRKKAEGLKKKK